MPAKKSVNDISREEDYRDYDTRNIDDGWPYADQAGATAPPVGNAAYGDTAANFDRERNKGFQVDSADETGLEEGVTDRTTPATKGMELRTPSLSGLSTGQVTGSDGCNKRRIKTTR